MEILFIFLIFENAIERYVPILSYSDEIISLMMLIALIFKLPFFKIKKMDLKIVFWFVLFLLIGILSTVIFRVDTNGIAILKDVVAVSKFFIVYLYGTTLKTSKYSEKLGEHIATFSRAYIPVLLVFGIINQFFNIGMDSGYRGFIKTFAFLYSHTTFMVASVVVLCSILVAQGIRKNRIILLMAVIVLILSMRSKAFVYIASVFILLFLFRNQRTSRKVTDRKYILTRKIRNLVIIASLCILVIAYFIVKNKVTEYLNWGLTAARPALYIVGFQIFSDYFPLGAGFGTFASSISGEYYSPLYFKYGIANVSGLQQAQGYPYISDTYWPYIIGQFGFLGSLAYFMALFKVFQNLFNMYHTNVNQLIAAFSLFAYLISGSFVESMFTNSTIILAALTLAYYIRIMTNTSKNGMEVV